jgi:hypothetical protein
MTCDVGQKPEPLLGKLYATKESQSLSQEEWVQFGIELGPQRRQALDVVLCNTRTALVQVLMHMTYMTQ